MDGGLNNHMNIFKLISIFLKYIGYYSGRKHEKKFFSLACDIQYSVVYHCALKLMSGHTNKFVFV